VKRIIFLVLFLLCGLCFLVVFSSYNPMPDPQDIMTQPDATEPPIPSANSSDLPFFWLDPDYIHDGSDIMIYEPGVYKAGIDIPAGVYMAVNDGSDISRVTIKDSPEPVTEKPNIIITARYVQGSARFADREIYADAVRSGGGTPVMPYDDEDLAKILSEGLVEYASILAERYDGLLLSGGGDVAAHFFNQEHHPASNTPDEILDVAEMALFHAFYRAGKPVLGVCRGMQEINIASGGGLIQDIPDLLGLESGIHMDYETRHPIKIRTGSWLYELVGSHADVTSTHHQCVDAVARGFTVVAQTGPVIEAMESGNILGVQFHPERMLDEGMLPLFKDFIERCSYNYFEVNIFSKHIIIQIEEDQYIDVSGASLVKIEDTVGMIEAMFETYGHYPEGMYLVGHHIPEGEYRLIVADDVDFSSYAIYTDITRRSCQHSGMISTRSGIITLKTGQLVSLIHATMTPVTLY